MPPARAGDVIGPIRLAEGSVYLGNSGSRPASVVHRSLFRMLRAEGGRRCERGSTEVIGSWFQRDGDARSAMSLRQVAETGLLVGCKAETDQAGLVLR